MGAANPHRRADGVFQSEIEADVLSVDYCTLMPILSRMLLNTISIA
jgi:hypothetical protein